MNIRRTEEDNQSSKQSIAPGAEYSCCPENCEHKQDFNLSVIPQDTERLQSF
jgi:hypothetical protein